MSAEPFDEHTVTALVADATAALSLHNAQPWTFRYFRGTGVPRLYADLERTLPRTDSEKRALHPDRGTVLLNLGVADAAAGPTHEVRLLPDPADAEFLAEAHLHGTTSADKALAPLRSTIHRRHSSRHPFHDEGIPAVVQERLYDAARAEGAELLFPGARHARSRLERVRDAEDREVLDAGRHGETEQWTHTESSGTGGAPDGIPAEAFGPDRRGATVPVRDFAVGRPLPGRAWASFEKNPNIAPLGTARDGSADWPRAGQARERVRLRATADGLVASVTSRPLEWSGLCWAARDPLSAMAQMVLRLGYGPEGRPPASAVGGSARRRVKQDVSKSAPCIGRAWGESRPWDTIPSTASRRSAPLRARRRGVVA
ncbi:Acg family FMN-binding oxidoreductase [Streptomyces mirabilis]|uniref:Acg family FMN-binding oxidoreductase n=1 Tax=Streptomyces mirabilis TaxID=68239 RepID=UPI002E29F550|nr:nitroreductase [Streptomyces mirabilis]